MTAAAMKEAFANAETINLWAVPDRSILNGGRRDPAPMPSGLFGPAWPLMQAIAEGVCPPHTIRGEGENILFSPLLSFPASGEERHIGAVQKLLQNNGLVGGEVENDLLAVAGWYPQFDDFAGVVQFCAGLAACYQFHSCFLVSRGFSEGRC